MNVPWPNVSRLVRLGAWDSSERSGPWMILPGVSQPLDRGDAGVDQRDVDALAGIAGGPPGLCARVLGRRCHGVDVARRVVAGRLDARGAEGRHEEGSGEDDAQPATAGEVEAPAEGRRHRTGLARRIRAPARPRVSGRACLGSSKAVRSGCTIEVHLQEGLLMRRLATGRSCRVTSEDPWLCVPVSRRVCPVSDRIL